MRSILLKSILIAYIVAPSCYARDDFPKINDIFKSLSEDSEDIGAVTILPGAVVRNIDINLETLNMSTFREKVEGYSTYIVALSCYAKDDFPKINDIFKSLSEDSQDIGADTILPGAVVRNIDINIETLNMSTFREKVEGYSKAFSTNASDGTNLLVSDYNNTRRLEWKGSWGNWQWASKVMTLNKVYDLMLQTIYMARHKIKQIENDPYYNPDDTSYRIAYLLRKLLRIKRKAIDLYLTMKKNVNNPRRLRWPLTRFLVLHHKAARLHVDFLYLWWVMVRLNERFAFRHHVPNTTPKRGKYAYLSNSWP